METKNLVYFLFFTFSFLSFASPMAERTSLPIPNKITLEDKEILEEIVKLEVYQDDRDADQYYYVPYFHIRQYELGATRPFLSSEQINHYYNAKDLIKERADYPEKFYKEKMAGLENNIGSLEGDLKRELFYQQQDLDAKRMDVDKRKISRDEAMKSLREVLSSGNQQLIEIFQENFQFEKERYEIGLIELKEIENSITERKNQFAEEVTKIREQIDLLTYRIERNDLPLAPGWSGVLDDKIMGHLALAGHAVPREYYNDPVKLKDLIDKAINKVENSYAGFLSMNIYAGFTKKQLNALRRYISDYMPDLKVSLMTPNNMEFFSLTELKPKEADASAGNTLFNNLKGSGDYLGANVVFDVSVLGAMGLLEHMGPFIVPLGLKAGFLQKADPTDAKLECNFTTGFLINGRGDIRDGLIIYDNDITNNFDDKDISKGGCKLRVTRGDSGSARLKAMENIKNFFIQNNIHQTRLAKSEKEKFLKTIYADMENNRRPSGGRYDTIFQKYDFGGGVVEVIIEKVAEEADFHWHTSIQNIEQLSDLTFEDEIHLNGLETLPRDIAMNLCLVHNPKTGSYDRCNEQEFEMASNMQKAIEDAHSSIECKEAQTASECGKNRDIAGRNPPRVVEKFEDSLLESNI